jgi:hypothetical protein
MHKINRENKLLLLILLLERNVAIRDDVFQLITGKITSMFYQILQFSNCNLKSVYPIF